MGWAQTALVPQDHAGPLAWWRIVLSVRTGVVYLLVLGIAAVSWRWWPKNQRRRGAASKRSTRARSELDR
jgi:hypothetical protein